MRRSDKEQIMGFLAVTPEFKSSEVAVAEEVIDCYLNNPQSGYYVVVAEESSVVGYVCYGPTPLTESTWDIYWLAVRSEYQRQGIGGRLLQFAEERIEENGGRHAFIETSSKSEYARAVSLYERRGYELLVRIEDFYSPGDAKLILRKRFRRT